MEEVKFEELGLNKNILKALNEMGYKIATSIQSKAIPEILNGKDLIGQSKTGTGKTASYGLPIINKIDVSLNKIQAIILCPTRELAVQVTQELRKFTKYQEGIKCLAVYGGEGIEKQIKGLKSGVKIVVGTPGRIMDHMRRKTIKFDNLKMVVLDEADEMLNMGFEEDMRQILGTMPKDRQTLLFSATMNKRILDIAQNYLNNPINIKIKSKELTVNSIEQILIETKQAMKDEATIRIIEVNNCKKVVVFCNTKKKVDTLIEKLKKSGYNAEALHGDIKQDQRERIMKRFKKGDFQVLVCTDVAARGIDVEELELVINYDIPQEQEYYVHRIGRTGRNGASGKAYTFVVGKEKNKIQEIQNFTKTNLVLGKLPTIEEVNKARNKKMIQMIRKEIEQNKSNNEQIDEIFEELLKDNSIETIAKALLSIKLNIENIPKKNIFNVEDLKEKEDKEGNIRLFFNLGKKDKIMVKDIVGSISANTAVSGKEIGKINILDKFSFVDVPTKYVEEIITSMKGKQIKGKDVNIEIANSK